MDVVEALKQIEQGRIAPVYVAVGEEAYLRRKFLQGLREQVVRGPAAALNEQRMDAAQAPVDEVLAVAQQLPVFAEQRLLILEAADAWLQGRPALDQAAQQAMIRYLEAPSPTTCMVLTAERLDRRNALVKALERHATIVRCDAMKEQELVSWLQARAQQEGKRLSAGAARLLVDLAGTDMQRLTQELDKVLTYAEAAIDEADVDRLVAADGPLNVFALLDAIIERRAETAIALLRRHQQAGEPNLRILSMLTKQLRTLLLVRHLAERGETADAIQKRLGVHPYVVKKSLQQARRLTGDDLTRALTLCVETETAIKTGRWPEDFALERLAARLAGNAGVTRTTRSV